jgi:long-subunit acyl-CoA synthetase (AMP-forming)
LLAVTAKKSIGPRKTHTSILSVADIVDIHLNRYSSRPAIRYDTGTTYATIGFDAYLRHLKATIRALKSRGVTQKVFATFCANRLEWDLSTLATFYTANILCPLDVKLNDTELKHVLSIGPPDYILVSRAQLHRLRTVLAELSITPQILVADLYPTFEDEHVPPIKLRNGELSFQYILATADSSISIVASPQLKLADTILGHYPTSGTTTLPKIVRITHGNIVAQVNETADLINLRNNEDLLNIHSYTHIVMLAEFLVTKMRGFTVTYFSREPEDDDVLENEIKKLTRVGIRIKVLLATPRFWIFLLKQVLEEMKNTPTLYPLYKYIESFEKNHKLYDIGTLDKAKLAAMKTSLCNKLGGYFSYGLSSSAKIDGTVVEIFGKLGITIIEVYHVTECSGIISRNRLNDIAPGTCGQMSSLLEYRLADQRKVPRINATLGVLEVKGPTVMHSYLGEERNHRCPGDDYFRTGDLCWFDERGYLHVLGREEELIRWDDGSYIDPQHLSNLLMRNIYVKDALVTRLRPLDNFLSVFIYPDYERIHKDEMWKKDIETGVSEHMALRTRLEQAIEFTQSVADMTPELSKKPIYILPHALERTPTHNIKYLFELNRLHLATTI